ncbi:MAG: Glycosylphosphatidylinositol (GPI) anchor assembly protein [Icmadophila ericetorum]|nr:Glycosylphosphatidylinositol (GPI) anchor assembly protein [Icmadophila ericetorum]
MTTEEGKSRYITPTTQPISILPTDISNTFTHIHPTLLLSYYYFRFPSLVADPVSTLSFDLLLLAAWQLTYAILCLPAHKSANPAQPVSKESKASLRKKQSPAKGNGGLSNKLVVCVTYRRRVAR